MSVNLWWILLFVCISEIRKVLSKISKEKGCEVLQEWIKPCENHLYWSVTSTFSGNGKVSWAKFSSFLSHIVNKHSNIPDALFNKCFHGAIHPRKWLKVGKIMSLNPWMGSLLFIYNILCVTCIIIIVIKPTLDNYSMRANENSQIALSNDPVYNNFFYSLQGLWCMSDYKVLWQMSV